jgi:hypothetical protein
MKRESFPFKTRTEIVGGLDMARVMARLVPPTSRNLRRFGEITVPSTNERAIETALEQERRRFQRQDGSIQRTQNKVAGYRRRLLGTVIKNRRLMELRAQLQKARYVETPQNGSERPVRTKHTKKFKSIRYGS